MYQIPQQAGNIYLNVNSGNPGTQQPGNFQEPIVELHAAKLAAAEEARKNAELQARLVLSEEARRLAEQQSFREREDRLRERRSFDRQRSRSPNRGVQEREHRQRDYYSAGNSYSRVGNNLGSGLATNHNQSSSRTRNNLGGGYEENYSWPQSRTRDNLGGGFAENYSRPRSRTRANLGGGFAENNNDDSSSIIDRNQANDDAAAAPRSGEELFPEKTVETQQRQLSDAGPGTRFNQKFKQRKPAPLGAPEEFYPAEYDIHDKDGSSRPSKKGFGNGKRKR